MVGRSKQLFARASLVLAATSGCAYVYSVPATGAGCEGQSAKYFPATDVVALIAARDLECKEGAVDVEATGETTFRAFGCGRSTRYTCEDDALTGCTLEEASQRESCERMGG